jgi:hypothetical protein
MRLQQQDVDWLGVRRAARQPSDRQQRLGEERIPPLAVRVPQGQVPVQLPVVNH